jgi:hypothetical protein
MEQDDGKGTDRAEPHLFLSLRDELQHELILQVKGSVAVIVFLFLNTIRHDE